MSKEHLLKLTVLRNDSMPAFGAFMACNCADPACHKQGTVLLNLEAIFGEMQFEDGTPAPSISPSECKELLIETLMHEFGHALEQYFQSEFSEELMERITESYRAKKSANN